MNKDKKIIICIPIWGHQYIDFFFNNILPLQFTDLNLKIFKKKNYDAYYYFYSFDKDIEYFSNYDNFKKLCDIIDVKLVSMDQNILYKSYPYRISLTGLTLAHNLAIQLALEQKAALINLCSDCVIADSFFHKLICQYEMGYSLIAISAIRLQKETFIPKLAEELKKQNKINLSNKDLIEIGLQNIHSGNKTMFWKKYKRITKCPIQLYWSDDSKALLMRSMMLHPLFIDFENVNINECSLIPGNETIDWKWWTKINVDKSRIKLIQDSNELSLFEICSNTQGNTNQKMFKFLSNISAFLKINATSKHLDFFENHSCFVHFNEDLLLKEKLKSESQIIVDKIIKQIKHPNKITEMLWGISKNFNFSKIRNVLHKLLKFLHFRRYINFVKKRFSHTNITFKYVFSSILFAKGCLKMILKVFSRNKFKSFLKKPFNFSDIKIFIKSQSLKKSKEQFPECKLMLNKMGIPENAWFVCFNGYHKEVPSVYHQNSDINSLFSALMEIEKRGGWTIRIGDQSPEKLSDRFNQLKHFVDYSNSYYQSRYMEKYLASNCRFFIGSAVSSEYELIKFYKKPCVLINLLPFKEIINKSADLIIFKNYQYVFNKKKISIEEIFFNNIVNSIDIFDYTARYIVPIDNTENEIKEVTIEMLAKLENKHIKNDTNDLFQKNLRNLFLKYNHNCSQISNIGSNFIMNNKNLLIND